ncbi:hypothetical protein CLF_107217 [Clonorchis sinensis]|uniref:Uncharacterized protein n=1 Tax=Clonorchis sinensis TaxID=79923 RepID=G7YGC6_CLOSI|nr:hypothetical protein CLF_107217 [Clonorchis sinensis]
MYDAHEYGATECHGSTVTPLRCPAAVGARWSNWLERRFTDRKVRGLNPTSASRLILSMPGQPGSIPALVQPSDGMAVVHGKGATAERFFSSCHATQRKYERWDTPRQAKLRCSGRVLTTDFRSVNLRSNHCHLAPATRNGISATTHHKQTKPWSYRRSNVRVSLAALRRKRKFRLSSKYPLIFDIRRSSRGSGNRF